MKEFLGYLTSYDEHTLVMEVRIKTRKMTVTIEQEKSHWHVLPLIFQHNAYLGVKTK